MNLLRFVVLCLLGWLIGRALRRIGRPTPPKSAPSAESFETMARCLRCGVHLPQRALSVDGHCSNCDAHQ